MNSNELILKSKELKSYVYDFLSLIRKLKKRLASVVLLVLQKILNLSLLSFVSAPLFVFFMYMVFFQSPLYESEARISIENNDVNNTFMLNIGFMGQGATDQMRNAYLAKSFIESDEMLRQLDREQHFIKSMSSKKIDFLSRLSSRSNHLEQLSFYRKMIDVSFDQETNELLISLKAFSAQKALNFLEETLKGVKNFANRISNSLASKRYDFTKKQLANYKQKLYLAEVELIKFQNSHGIFDPKETAKSVATIMAKLKEQLVSKQTELFTLSSFMQPSSSKIISLKEEISAIKKQLKEQTHSLLGNEKQETLNTVLADYEWKELNLKFAYAEYEAAQKAYELASLDLSKQQNVLVVLSEPTLPDDKSYPKIFFNLVLAALGLTLIYIILKMAKLIVEEHTD